MGRAGATQALAHVPGSNDGHRPNAKSRSWGDPAAATAASTAMVPEPVIGSTTGRLPSWPAARSIAAARVGRRGAA